MGKVIIAVVVAAGLVLFVAYDYLINNACVGVDGCGGSPREFWWMMGIVGVFAIAVIARLISVKCNGRSRAEAGNQLTIGYKGTSDGE
jgi:protein-S-isoprenylcysteine O-methyltransferase Ste14